MYLQLIESEHYYEYYYYMEANNDLITTNAWTSHFKFSRNSVFNYCCVCCWFEGKMLKQWTMDRDIKQYRECSLCKREQRKKKTTNNFCVFSLLGSHSFFFLDFFVCNMNGIYGVNAYTKQLNVCLCVCVRLSSALIFGLLSWGAIVYLLLNCFG